MGVFSFWGNRKQTENDVINLPEVFCLKLGLDDFIKEKALSFYEALLTQCYLRSENFPDDKATTLWNRYNMIDPILSKGVISLLATALVEKRTMAIAYDKTTRTAIPEKVTLALAFVMAMNYLAILLCPFIIDFFQSILHVKSQQFAFIFNLCIALVATIWAYVKRDSFLFNDKI